MSIMYNYVYYPLYKTTSEKKDPCFRHDVEKLEREGSNDQRPGESVSEKAKNSSLGTNKVLPAALGQSLLSSPCRAFYFFLFHPSHPLFPSKHLPLRLELVAFISFTSAKFISQHSDPSSSQTPSHQSTSCLTVVVVTAARAAAAAAAAVVVTAVVAMATLAGTNPRDPTDKAPTATIQPVALMTGMILNKSLLKALHLSSTPSLLEQ